MNVFVSRLCFYLVIIGIQITLIACTSPQPVPEFSDHTLEARPGEWEWATWAASGRL